MWWKTEPFFFKQIAYSENLANYFTLFCVMFFCVNQLPTKWAKASRTCKLNFGSTCSFYIIYLFTFLPNQFTANTSNDRQKTYLSSGFRKCSTKSMLDSDRLNLTANRFKSLIWNQNLKSCCSKSNFSVLDLLVLFSSLQFLVVQFIVVAIMTRVISSAGDGINYNQWNKDKRGFHWWQIQ